MIDVSIAKGLSALQPIAIAKRAHESVSNGEISEHRFGEIQKQLALAMFPAAPNEGVALAKFFETAAGAAMLAPRRRMSVAENAALMKAEARPGEEDPPAERIDDGGDHEHSDKYYARLCDMAKEHMANEAKAGRRMSFEQAFTHVAFNSDEGKTNWDAHKAHQQTIARSHAHQRERV